MLEKITIWYWDSNSRPLEHEPPPMTTRSRLPPSKFSSPSLSLSFFLSLVFHRRHPKRQPRRFLTVSKSRSGLQRDYKTFLSELGTTTIKHFFSNQRPNGVQLHFDARFTVLYRPVVLRKVLYLNLSTKP